MHGGQLAAFALVALAAWLWRQLTERRKDNPHWTCQYCGRPHGRHRPDCYMRDGA